MWTRRSATLPLPSVSTSNSISSSASSLTIPATPDSSFSVPTTPTNGSLGFKFTSSEIQAPSSAEYQRSQALDDLPLVRRLLHLFLGGKMLESEKACADADPKKERLYPEAGLAIVSALKGLMSFEEADINHALEIVKHSALIASQHRRPASSLTSRLAGLVIGGASSGVGFIKSMTPVERHAELVYCECLLEKAVLGIVSSGDWLTFIREFLNIRAATNVYRTLGDFIKVADAEAVARGEGPVDKTIDRDFRSGVALGLGINALSLSLLPESVSNIVALFGYKGDRHEALSILASPGGWSDTDAPPAIGVDEQGLRRPCTDLTLLMFHLFVSSITYKGVNIPQARSILEHNLKLYPEGVFFLFLNGRLHVIESRLDDAIRLYEKGMEHTEYKSLKGVAQWEIGLYKLALHDFAGAIPYWRAQESESNWSKAVYSYGLAAALYEAGGEENLKEATKYFSKTPTVVRKIAGKSILAEKFVSRKSRKYEAQGRKLLLPATEFAYIFSAIQHTPRRVFIDTTIPRIEAAIKHLDSFSKDPSKYQGGKGYWDDMALARLLLAVSLRYVAHPDPEAVETEEEIAYVKSRIPQDQAVARSFELFKWVIEIGPKIELDHQLVYAAHLDMGKLYACVGDKQEAHKHLELVVSGKPLEVNAAGKKGHKYSMQNSIQMKAHSAIEALDTGHRI